MNQTLPVHNWGVKIKDERGTRWYTNERHSKEDAVALERCYKKAHRNELMTFKAAEIQDGENY